MTTIDDLGRQAADAARNDARRTVDVERGLAEVLTVAPTTTSVGPYEAYGTRTTGVRWFVVAASIVVVAGTAVALAVLPFGNRSPSVPVGTVDGAQTSEPRPSATVAATARPPIDTAGTTPATTAPPTTTTSVSPPTEPPPAFTVESLGIDAVCDASCVTVGVGQDGGLVVYDPAAATLRVLGPTLRTVDVSGAGLDPEMSYLELVGPEQVAYLATRQPGAQDPVGNLLAIATVGPRAGEVVGRAEGIDLSGDSDLVPTLTGIVVVGCCDAAPVRPDPSAAPILEWWGSFGSQVLFGAPDLRVELHEGSMDVVRAFGATTITWTVRDVPGFRGMPPLVATDDGGAMVSAQDTFDPSSPSRIVLLHPDGTMDERSIAPYLPVALSPDGSIVVVDDGEYARLRFTDSTMAEPAVPADDLAIEPFVDPDICTVVSSRTTSVVDETLRPFAASNIAPMSLQVIGEPAPDGAAGPFAVVLRYPEAVRPIGSTGTATRRIGDWDVALQAYSNGNGEARWDLPDGTQGYLRSRGLNEVELVGVVERLVARPLTAAVPGFDHDDAAAPASLHLVVDDLASGVSGSVGYAECVSPISYWYRITTLDGDGALVFLGVIDREVPATVGIAGDDVVVINGLDDPAAPTVADVVPLPDDT